MIVFLVSCLIIAILSFVLRRTLGRKRRLELREKAPIVKSYLRHEEKLAKLNHKIYSRKEMNKDEAIIENFLDDHDYLWRNKG
jgi:hypothetical protein